MQEHAIAALEIGPPGRRRAYAEPAMTQRPEVIRQSDNSRSLIGKDGGRQTMLVRWSNPDMRHLILNQTVDQLLVIG